MTRHPQTVIGGSTGPHVEPVAARARFRWSADVIRHLDEEVDWALTSNPTGPAEIAGILLGQSGRHIQIRDCRPVLLLRKQDHEYALTGPGRREFERKMAEFRWIPERSVVGFYRSHMGEGLELSEEDLGLLQTCFRDTSQVVLLIKPTGDRSCSAKLFVGNQGQLLSEFHSDEDMGLPRWLGLWQHLSTNVPRDRPSAAKETTAPADAATPTYTATASNTTTHAYTVAPADVATPAPTVAPAPIALREDTPSPAGKELPDLAYLYAIMATSQTPVALDRGAKYRHIFIFAALAVVALLVGYFMLKA
jgi:proteasome lid subunit RPN8/RPN11